MLTRAERKQSDPNARVSECVLDVARVYKCLKAA